jgi:hypothetical protein
VMGFAAFGIYDILSSCLQIAREFFGLIYVQEMLLIEVYKCHFSA